MFLQLPVESAASNKQPIDITKYFHIYLLVVLDMVTTVASRHASQALQPRATVGMMCRRTLCGPSGCCCRTWMTLTSQRGGCPSPMKASTAAPALWLPATHLEAQVPSMAGSSPDPKPRCFSLVSPHSPLCCLPCCALGQLQSGKRGWTSVRDAATYSLESGYRCHATHERACWCTDETLYHLDRTPRCPP